MTTTDSPPAAHPVRRGQRARSERLRTTIAVGVVLFFLLLPLPWLLRFPGGGMEEGFMLVFPEQVLAGRVAHKDFLHLYGPGSLWVLAGVYEVFGTTILVERLVGLVQILGVAFGVYGLARWWGRPAAATGAVLAGIFTMTSLALTAIPWTGGLALTLGAVVAAVESRRRIERPVVAGRFAWLCGLAAGAALLYRPDLVLPVSLALVAVLWKAPRRLVLRAVGGAAIGLSPYVVHLLTAGLGNVWQGMVVDPVFRLRAGRSLSVPPPWGELEGLAQLAAANIGQEWWPLPRLAPSQQLFVWFFVLLAATALLVTVAVLAMRRERDRLRPRVLLAMAMLAIGLLPQMAQRADSNHLAWVSAVILAFMPAAVTQMLTMSRLRWTPRRAGVLASLVVVVLVLVAFPTWVARPYVTLVERSIGDTSRSYAIEWGDRRLYTGSLATRRAAQDLIDAVHEIGEPGDRVIVAPRDLRRTPYVETALYHLLPGFEPGTYFIEMEPGITNAPGTRLTRELREADILIQSSLDGWDEPNDSTKPGDPLPQQVVDEQFCEVGDFGPGIYWLSVRCERLPARQ